MSTATAPYPHSNSISFNHSQTERQLTNTANDGSDSSIVNIAFILDTDVFHWAPDLVEAILHFVNDRTDGWHDRVFDSDNTTVRVGIANSQCQDTIAAQAYWSFMSAWNSDIHGIVGGRCSGASRMVAILAAHDNIAQISPSATSSTFTKQAQDYPLFSRTVSPDNRNGQVGALVALLQDLSWRRVHILLTDRPYSKGIADDFRELWKQVGGEAFPAPTIELIKNQSTNDDDVDTASVQRALNALPQRFSSQDSRIILLFAHNEHAFEIIRIATVNKMVRDDVVWVVPETPTNRSPADLSWASQAHPGYIGVTPYRNTDDVYTDFLRRYNDFRLSRGKPTIQQLPDYAAEYMIDAFLALTKALSALQPSSRRDGYAVTQALRSMRFDGITGRVAFTGDGDRQDPVFSVFNMHRSESEGTLQWEQVGTIAVSTDDTHFRHDTKVRASDLCFPTLPCGVIPAAFDPPPTEKEATGSMALWLALAGMLLVVLAVALNNRRHRRKLSKVKQLQMIDIELSALKEDNSKRASLIRQRGYLIGQPESWTDDGDGTLFDVPEGTAEFEQVLGRLQESLPTARITKLWRVQNKSQWAYYNFQKDKMEMDGIKDPEETYAWHGTSTIDPSVIYNDLQNGFMMQLAAIGIWGRGLYFAEKSAYSHCFAHKPHTYQQEQCRVGGHNGSGGDNGGSMEVDAKNGDNRDNSIVINTSSISRDQIVTAPYEREMFLTKLLIGTKIRMDYTESREMELKCRSLITPPIDPSRNKKYYTVEGAAGGSTIWVVYENGRAYPEYLVRYYITEDMYVDQMQLSVPYRSPGYMQSSIMATEPAARNGDADRIQLSAPHSLPEYALSEVMTAEPAMLETAVATQERYAHDVFVDPETGHKAIIEADSVSNMSDSNSSSSSSSSSSDYSDSDSDSDTDDDMPNTSLEAGDNWQERMRRDAQIARLK